MLQLVNFAELAAERVTVAVERLLPEAAPVRPLRALRQGRSHSSWVLESGLGRLVGKVQTTDRTEVVLDRLAEQRRVAEHGVPVPNLLGFTPSSEPVGGRLLIVAEYLDGQDAEEASTSLLADVMADALRSAGAALAHLHRVPVPAFGDATTGLHPGPHSWAEVITARTELLRRAYGDRNGSVDSAAASVVSAGLALLVRLGDAVSHAVRPAVAHLDVYLPNILVDAEGQFRALLDLEHVRWVDPAMDFVKPAMWMFEGRPEWADAFADGYGITESRPPYWSERLSVATGLELLTGVDYWTRVKDPAMREDYLRRLRSWVRSDGADHVWPSVVT